MKKQTTKAKNPTHWWELIKKDYQDWNRKAHPDDQIPWSDWVGEMSGPPGIYGYVLEIRRDRYGDAEYILHKSK